MYKEFRDITLTAATQKLYAEMAARHRARRSSIQIIRTATVPSSQAKRANTLQFIDNSIKFKLLHRVTRPSDKSFKKTFKGKRPVTLRKNQ
jgi:large subunit ribosomal protein L18Ae